MAHISIDSLSVRFTIYGTNSQSLKKQILTQATGGRVVAGERDLVNVQAIDALSLEIHHGDRVGLVGHNGSGKSTLLRVLAGIYKPNAGTVRINGTVGALLDPNAGMDPDATGIENIFLRGFILGMSRSQIASMVPEITEFTELGEFINLPLRTYSAGMFARLAFGISTAIKPDILLMDEGIGAGDPVFLEKMHKRLERSITDASILVIASHDSSIISRMCNKTVRLEHGRIIGEEELMPKLGEPLS